MSRVRYTVAARLAAPFAACPRCGLSFFREPGYYIGGMIITYGLTLVVVIPVFLLPDLRSVSDNGRFALWVLFAVPLSLLLMPYFYSLWLHLDFWFEPWILPRERF